jgi:hypothetical protein
MMVKLAQNGDADARAKVYENISACIYGFERFIKRPMNTKTFFK